MSAVVHSILEEDAAGTSRRLAAAPGRCALVEIRADRLRAADVGGLVREAARPVVVTVRSTEEGGTFDGSVEEQRRILEAALAAGAAFVDVAWDGPLRRWADGPEAARVILSIHGGPCDAAALRQRHGAMASTRAARLKIVPAAGAVTDAQAIRALLAHAARSGPPTAAFATGEAGVATRVLALSWGSWGTYGAAAPGRETASGQLLSSDLLDVYRVLEIGPATRRYALAGARVLRSPSPALHAAAFREAGIDGVYLPLPSTSIHEVEAVAAAEGALALSGLGVTVPLKEAAARRCVSLDRFAACGAVNTVVFGAGWAGFNTDAPAALALIRPHLEPAGATVAVVGAGGTARAIAAALVAAGARVTLFNRTEARAAETARAVGASAAPLGALSGASWDLLVQATPLGSGQEGVLPARRLTGRMVLDAAYGPEPTPLVREARARGLAVADGFDLLAAQAEPQFALLTGASVRGDVFRAALAPWRSPLSA